MSSVDLTLNGSGSQTLSKVSGTETVKSLTFNNSGSGTVTLSSPYIATNSLTLTRGKLIATSTNILTLNNGTTLTGGSDSAYVSGPLKKIGNTAFTFPLGNTSISAGAYHPLTISAPASTSDAFIAEFIPTGQSYGSTTDSLASLSSCEYWTLKHAAGTSAVTVGLNWNVNCNTSATNRNRVASWNGTKWLDNGGLLNMINPTKGKVTSVFSFSISTGSTLPIVVGNSPGYADNTLNWVEEEVFDESGNDLGAKKTYMDNLGRNMQSLKLDNTNNLVIATSTVYDSYGRAALQTLPAPGGGAFMYLDHFITGSTDGAPYNYTHFDQSSNLNSPVSVQSAGSNTVGNYYSSSGQENYVATSSYPYVRTEYTADPGGAVKRSAKAGDEYKMGSGHETRSWSMISGSELVSVFGNAPLSGANSFLCFTTSGNPLANTPIEIGTGIVATKVVTMNEDGLQAISYNYGDKVIATCYSGLSSPCTMTGISSTMSFLGTLCTDIHVPYSCRSSLTLPTIRYDYGGPHSADVADADVTFNIMDLNTNYKLVLGTDYSFNTTTRAVTFLGTYASALGANVFRISVTFSSSFLNNVATNGWAVIDPRVDYALDYSTWSVNYYDLAGNLRKSVSPGAINCSSPGTINFSTTYDYDTEHHLIASLSPDEGEKQMMYDDEGKMRFSQDAVQLASNQFSYVDYDTQGRPVEKGQSTAISAGIYFQNFYGVPSSAPVTGSVASSTVLDNTGTFSGSFADQFFTEYYKLSSGDKVPSSYTYYLQYRDKEFMNKPSRTWNDQTTTWYCYDQAGRLISTVAQMKDGDFTGASNYNAATTPFKTVDYNYNFYTGLLNSKVFQKNQTASPDEMLTHTYTYDADSRLQNVQTSGSGGTQNQQARYFYYETGALKRKELGKNVQGVDYVYTINGQLKSINHPTLDGTKDPGLDGQSGTNVNFAADIFGMTLDYHLNDFTRMGAAASITSSCISGATGSYNGLVSAFRWKQAATTNGNYNGADTYGIGSPVTAIVYTTDELMNRYTYDERNRLSISNFGVYSDVTSPSFTVSATNAYKEFGTSGISGIGYDDNGNITSLKRNGYDISGSALMDNLAYTYTSNTNTLASVTDGVSGSTWGDFSTGSGTAYTYDANGRMITDAPEQVTNVNYNSFNKTSKVTFSFSSSSYAEYWYDDAGRKYKTKYTNVAAGNAQTIWYAYDGNNVAAEYLQNTATNTTVNITDEPIYGAGRIGVLHKADGVVEYELTDHLGNVRATVKYAGLSGTQTIAQLTGRNDFYAFGGQMTGRSFSDGSEAVYRYGYQGQECAVETNWKMFELRMLSTDLGRWLAPDPMGQYHSPYISMGNNPVTGTDPNGGFVNINAEGNFAIGGRSFDNYSQYYNDIVLPDAYSLQNYRDELTALTDATRAPGDDGYNAFVNLQDKFGYSTGSSGMSGRNIDFGEGPMNGPSSEEQRLSLMSSGMTNQEAADAMAQKENTIIGGSQRRGGVYGETSFNFYMASFDGKSLGMFGSSGAAYATLGKTIISWVHAQESIDNAVASNENGPDGWHLYQSTPVLVNFSASVVHYKPEGGAGDGYSMPLGPNSYVSVAFDGVATSLHSDMVFKVSDGGDAVVMPNGEVTAIYSSGEQDANWLNVNVRGHESDGWKGLQFGHDNAWNWKNLFISAHNPSYYNTVWTHDEPFATPASGIYGFDSF